MVVAPEQKQDNFGTVLVKLIDSGKSVCACVAGHSKIDNFLPDFFRQKRHKIVSVSCAYAGNQAISECNDVCTGRRVVCYLRFLRGKEKEIQSYQSQEHNCNKKYCFFFFFFSSPSPPRSKKTKEEKKKKKKKKKFFFFFVFFLLLFFFFFFFFPA